VHPIKDEIQDRFDIIGVDVRGTGLSSPIKCDTNIANAKPPLWATTPEIFEASRKHNRDVYQSCIDKTGSRLVDFMDSLSQAHDNEAVRQALGGEKLTWLGQSAGTLLASQYAELYAENIRGSK
jgi:pimeloyl-ACP methyl ester carboxylesterase